MSAHPIRRRFVRHLRHWGLHWLAFAMLLAASQVLWLWQSWPVRELLAILNRAAP